MTTKSNGKQTSKTTEKTAGQIGAETGKTIDAGARQARKGMEAAAAFGQGNIEAIVASSTIATKALEMMTSEVAAYSKKSYEDGMAAAKELSSCRNVAELVEKQTAFQRKSLESLIAEASKLNELYAAAAKEAFEPLGKRFSEAVEMVKGYRF